MKNFITRVGIVIGGIVITVATIAAITLLIGVKVVTAAFIVIAVALAILAFVDNAGRIKATANFVGRAMMAVALIAYLKVRVQRTEAAKEGGSDAAIADVTFLMKVGTFVMAVVFFAIGLIGAVQFGIVYPWLVGGLVMAFFFAITNQQVKTPDLGIAYFAGDQIGYVRPFVYLKWPFVSIDVIDMKKISVLFGDDNIITEENTSIGMSGTVYIQAVAEHLEEVLALPQKEATELARQAALARLQVEISALGVVEGQRKKSTIAKKIERSADKAIGEGYHVTNVELSDVRETVITAAEKIRRIGLAHAKTAKAMHASMGDKAHQVQIAQGLGDTAVRIAEAFASAKSAARTDLAEMKTLATEAKGLLEKLAGGATGKEEK